MDETELVYAQVVDGLRLQAAPWEVQLRALPAFVHMPDEILNAVVTDYFPQLLRAGRIPAAAVTTLEQYEAFLDTYELTPDYGRPEDVLEHDPWFGKLRENAMELIHALGEDPAVPSVGGMTYVPGA